MPQSKKESNGLKRDNETLLAVMEDAAARTGIEVRYENLSDDEVTISSGLCYIRRKPSLIIDKRLTARQKWKILAKELADVDTQSVYLPPIARKIIEGLEDD